MSPARRLPSVLVSCLIVAIGSATLLGFLDRVSWMFELVGFFRFQFAILLGALAIVAFLLRRRDAAVVAVLLASVNVAVVAPRGAEAAPARGGWGERPRPRRQRRFPKS